MASAPHSRLYGLHEFIAENPDEVSFRVGETIVVVEKDDAYQDGWWQGTNEAGETGLFPYSYTTPDRDLAMNAKALALSAGGPQAASPTTATAMSSTMADLDEALTELQGDAAQTREQQSAQDATVRRSFQSHRTGDTREDEDEDDDNDGTGDESEYQARGDARAALAAKAKANADSEAERERAEQQRMKAQALKLFEEEEARQREMLLKKEAERKEAAAKGQLLNTRSDREKTAPIEGVDISDESESEGSAHDDDRGSQRPTSHQQQQQQSRSIVSSGFDTGAASTAVQPPTTARLDPQGETFDELDDVPSRPEAPTAVGNLATASGIAGPRSTDQRSVDSSTTRPIGSSQDDGVSTAPTSVGAPGDRDTPKSLSAPAMGALPPQTATAPLSPVSAPAGDPRDWSVDQVVSWARSRGWDEASVVSKFAEHEISGDVLLEMDINILKEIEIIAFGKRFQVASAIKELRGIDPSGTFPSSSASPNAQGFGNGSPSVDESRQPASSASAAAAAAAGVPGAGLLGLGVPATRPDNLDMNAAAYQQRDISYDRGTVITHDVPQHQSNDHGAASQRGASMPSPSSADQRMASQGGKSLAEQADEALISKRFPSPRQPEEVASSRRRDGPRPPGTGERSSFFSSFAPGRSRKAAPSSPGTGPTPAGFEAGASDDHRFSKGTFSKLGLNRLANRTSGGHAGSGAGSGDFKNQISLPTTSPTYDSMGDTARRNRASQLSAGSGNAGSSSANAPSATGSAGMDKNELGASGVNASGSGPVMSRIRPVDLEGWMHKKGEMYSSWKPRYLALKGTDLVVLRDPSAAKIKGYVSMQGYKVIGIADESATARKYGFKILHETEKPHYFSSDDPILVREWMKTLMKATIGRDNSFPVISSYNNATISLKDAQRMNPPPRPPSPTSRARTQRAQVRENLTELTAKDKAILRVPNGQKGTQ
ncbi:unnamed protein product [Parajaminaea phylloscopi]